MSKFKKPMRTNKTPSALPHVTRRTFLSAAGTTAGVALVGRALAATAAHDFSEARYRNAIVIDAMGDLAGYTPEGSLEYPRGAAMLKAVQASGLTAINTNAAAPWPEDAFKVSQELFDDFDATIARYPDRLMMIRAASDLQRAKDAGKLGIILCFQGAFPIEQDLDRVTLFRKRGLRVLQLTYNLRNLAGDGALQPNDQGLTKFGRQLIERLQAERILVDLSHGSAKTIADTLAMTSHPVSITHSGCRNLVDSPRNVWDRDLKKLADKGGVVGIYLMPFLRKSGQPQSEDFIRHIEHAIQICGEDHVGIGTDGAVAGAILTKKYRAEHRASLEDRLKKGIAAPGESVDVFNFVPRYNTPHRMKLIADDMARAGHKASRIEKILGANFARLFGEAWGG